ncbi:hypothetical protein N7474_001972 [Penicillium riverlandense]|uniref:uncharacterized protein n=1 Tax=Penicillium riverlandense TaxID=1903569 RepID=UPI002547F3F2|nr:uncharacterized protein N7474_001972 [Penicillium riverlandense]KAJ5833661.1 hypothetical protein N7474_001972 [Penicillium riverlandense]
MSDKPIFVAAHPRACSTAFERVFMTQHDTIQCVHEPFGDAFYYGPERLSTRFADDEQTRLNSGFSKATYGSVLEGIKQEASQGKRVFIKDIDYYLFALDREPTSIAPSFQKVTGGHLSSEAARTNGCIQKKSSPHPTLAEPENPTVMPREIQEMFHFTFLIRDPHYSVPSYYRCTIPPLREITNFYYDPLEAGYDELRRHFDYLKETGLVGPHVATRPELSSPETKADSGLKKCNGHEICVVDADDLLDAPAAMIEAFCESVGLQYDPRMLQWDREIDHAVAKDKFEKWRGFHDDALDSDGLQARAHKRAPKSEEDFDAEWRAKYGEEAAAMIRKTVDQNMPHYLYLKQFAMRV